MARRRKGNPVTGWLIVDKPAGLTSAAIVNKVKWACNAQKAGHAGTLDPAATGLLVVALGEATKAIPYVTDALKAYRFTVRWGQSTNTDDTEGEITGQSDMRPDARQIETTLPRFRGQIEQIPPQFSAVKVDGERAYDLARDGQVTELKSRPLWVEDLRLVEMPDADHSVFEMTCGKGGYVRSVARDLGTEMGCLGHVTSLRRIWSGPFDLDDAVTFAQIEAAERSPAILEFLHPLEAGLTGLPCCTCSPEASARIRNGNPGDVIASDADFGETVWVRCGETPVALGTYLDGRVQPTRVFNLS